MSDSFKIVTIYLVHILSPKSIGNTFWVNQHPTLRALTLDPNAPRPRCTLRSQHASTYHLTNPEPEARDLGCLGSKAAFFFRSCQLLPQGPRHPFRQTEPRVTRAAPAVGDTGIVPHSPFGRLTARKNKNKSSPIHRLPTL